MKKNHTIRRNVCYTACMFIFLFLAGCQQQPATENNEDDNSEHTEITSGDMGKNPWVLDIEEATIDNTYYREVSWTGNNMQLVLMSLEPGEIIDLELHDEGDQFIRIEQGDARILMGETKENLTFDETVSDDWAILIPAGYWHEVRNIGDTELKIYALYAPSEHPSGTRHETYEEAEEYAHEHEH